MRTAVAVAALALASFAPVSHSAPVAASGPQALSLADAAVAFPMPESKARKGSRRVGGTNSKGKGSHYVGGRR